MLQRRRGQVHEARGPEPVLHVFVHLVPQQRREEVGLQGLQTASDGTAADKVLVAAVVVVVVVAVVVDTLTPPPVVAVPNSSSGALFFLLLLLLVFGRRRRQEVEGPLDLGVPPEPVASKALHGHGQSVAPPRVHREELPHQSVLGLSPLGVHGPAVTPRARPLLILLLLFADVVVVGLFSRAAAARVLILVLLFGGGGSQQRRGAFKRFFPHRKRAVVVSPLDLPKHGVRAHERQGHALVPRRLHQQPLLAAPVLVVPQREVHFGLASQRGPNRFRHC
mmetsp:Transcript_10555/g.17898  ORF Transcript_10555/g.17898 Transcript_10555/m.17898 type:complete len:279 (+) Transcript_10555:927-1763(+)